MSLISAAILMAAETQPANLIRRAATTAPAAGDFGLGDILRTLGALVIVLGGVWALRLLLKRFAPAMGGGGAVKVISRTHISQRQSVLLIEVGKRVLVVADSGGRLTTLAEIRDAEEIALLRGRPGAEAAKEQAEAN